MEPALGMPPARRPGRLAAWRAPGRTPWLAALGTFLLTLPLLWAFYQRHPLLYDTDSSYHLAIARGITEHGLRHELPLRMSAITQHGPSDGSLLFHLVLAPFARSADPLAGGRLALALLDALLLATIAGLACRAAGWWGLVATLAIGAGCLEVAWRLVRLRPELLALPLLLLALAAAGLRRYRWLGAIAAAFALAYFAWHAFLLLFLLLFLFRGWVRRRWEWPLALYPLLGTGLGLVLHPSLPSTLVFWKLQVFDVFRLRGTLDTGSELEPSRFDVMLFANLGFWVFAAAAWRSRTTNDAAADARAPARELADAFGLAALGFAAAYLAMSRFAIYAFVLGGLWLLFTLAARGERIGPRVRLPFRGSLPTGAVLVAGALLAAPGTVQELSRFSGRTNPGPNGERVVDRAAFSRAVPGGARVAARWGDTANYLLWAPQGRYLNAADPAFLAIPYPRAHEVQRAVFAGEEPDVPLATAVGLDSDHVAWSRPGAPPRLFARLRGDPRARPLHTGYQALFALEPAPPGSFVLDWRVVPGGTVPPPAGAPVEGWPAYPRLREPEARAMEGFVDARRVRAADCVAFARGEGTGEAGTYELAASGPVKLWVDGELLLSDGGNAAVLGEGVIFRLPAAHRLTVLTCPAEGGHNGFYLLRRG